MLLSAQIHQHDQCCCLWPFTLYFSVPLSLSLSLCLSRILSHSILFLSVLASLSLSLPESFLRLSLSLSCSLPSMSPVYLSLLSSLPLSVPVPQSLSHTFSLCDLLYVWRFQKKQSFIKLDRSQMAFQTCPCSIVLCVFSLSLLFPCKS